MNTPEVVTGKSLTFASEFARMPDIEREDPEIIIDIFEEAKRLCIENGNPVDFHHVFWRARQALHLVIGNSLREHNQLALSIIEPGFEVFRWFPKYSERLGIDMTFVQMTDYLEPTVTMALRVDSIAQVHNILKQNPELEDELKKLPKKPYLTLLDIGERGTVAAIVDKERKIVVKTTQGGENEKRIANMVSDIVGPRVIASSNEWIIEDYLESPPFHALVRDPDVLGTALGVALRKTHRLGISYNDEFTRHLKIDPKSHTVRFVDWGVAEESGETKKDISTAISTIKEIYVEDRDEMIKGLKSFSEGYK